MKDNKFQAAFGVITLLFVLAIPQLIISGIFDIVRVDEREAAVITEFGKLKTVKKAGWHFKTPYISQHSAQYDLSTLALSVDADSASSDQQAVQIKVNLQYRLDSTNIDNIYRLIGGSGNAGTFADDSIIDIVEPILQESTKSSSAQYTATNILSQRENLKNDIINTLQPKLDQYYIDVISINLENIEFSDQFNQAIEDKVTAQQRAEQARFEQEKATIELETERINSEALKVRGEALETNPSVLEEKKIEKWDGRLPQVQGQDGIIIDIAN